MKKELSDIALTPEERAIATTIMDCQMGELGAGLMCVGDNKYRYCPWLNSEEPVPMDCCYRGKLLFATQEVGGNKEIECRYQCDKYYT
jgi:hypothetical protein